MTLSETTCKYCDSDSIIKYGTYKGVQRYFCQNCQRKFVDTNTIPKMQYPTGQIGDALHDYFEGLSLLKIRRGLIQRYNSYVSDATIYNWVNRFSKLAIIEAGKYKPSVGGVWVADETVIDLDGKNVWFWDIIDAKTRFLIASHMSFTRSTRDAQELMKQAYERTGKIPRVIYTDKLAAYLDGIELTFGANTIHRQGGPFDIETNTNFIERFHGTIKSRTEIMRGLHTIDSARLFLDGWLVHYNFFRPHMSLKDRTPAQVAGVSFPFRNWRAVTEQPYHITARIPVSTVRQRKRVIKRKQQRKSQLRTASVSIVTARRATKIE